MLASTEQILSVVQGVDFTIDGKYNEYIYLLNTICIRVSEPGATTYITVQQEGRPVLEARINTDDLYEYIQSSEFRNTLITS